MRETSFTAVVHDTLAKTPILSLLEKDDAVILERIAMGGGATRWYYCSNTSHLGAIEKQLSPGSVVSFYFDERIKITIDSPEARLEIEKIINREKEAVIGRLCDNGLNIEVDFVSGLAGVDEFTSSLGSAASVFYGAFPARDNDGTQAVTITLPDDDGIVRPHPH